MYRVKFDAESTESAIRRAFPKEINRAFIAGAIAGAMAMAMLDLTDIHICVGECDGAGYDIAGPRR